MDRGAKIGLGARHHPAVDDHQVEDRKIGLFALGEPLFAGVRPMGGEIGGEGPAARAGAGVHGQMPTSETCGEARIAEHVVEQKVGPLTRQPGDGQSEARQRQGGQLDQTAAIHVLSLRRVTGVERGL